MTRAECLDYIYADIIRQQEISRTAFDSSMKEWNLESMVVDNKDIGVIATKGHEIHVVLDKRGALSHAKRIIKVCLVDRIAKHGYMTTRSFRGDMPVTRFLGRLGFQETHRDAICIYYRIEQVRIH